VSPHRPWDRGVLPHSPLHSYATGCSMSPSTVSSISATKGCVHPPFSVSWRRITECQWSPVLRRSDCSHPGDCYIHRMMTTIFRQGINLTSLWDCVQAEWRHFLQSAGKSHHTNRNYYKGLGLLWSADSERLQRSEFGFFHCNNRMNWYLF
jgi:hypothetical protein